LYRPNRATRAPVVLFLHGGAFTDGEKNRTPEIHANICRHFARNGVVGINVEYRQAPKWTHPAGAQDVGLAVQWTHENIASLDGDPSRIFIAGSSAGAAHTAAYAYDRRVQPPAGPGIAGHIVLSGRVRADNRPDNPNARKVEAYYGAESSRFDDLSPVTHVDVQSVPTMIAIAEYENPLIDVYCAELFYRLAQAKGRAPRFMRLNGHNHASIHAHIGTTEDRLGTELIDFVRTGR
jgi:acetyl esterase/lipase